MARIQDMVVIFNEKSIRAWTQQMRKLVEAITELDKSITRFNPQRREGESLVEWGIRLDRAGIFDNPDIRWEYGKACWKAVFDFILKPIHWIRKKANSLKSDSF